MSRREELLGTILLMGVGLFALIGFGLYQTISGSQVLLVSLLGWGWLAAVGALAITLLATIHEDWNDATRRAVGGFVALAVAGAISVHGTFSQPDPASAMTALGLILLGRSLMLRSTSDVGDQGAADFMLFALWATTAALLRDPLAALHLAVLAILVRRVAVRAVVAWRALAAKLRWLFTYREEAPSYVVPESTEYDPYAKMSAIQRERAGGILGYINQVYNGTSGEAPDAALLEETGAKPPKWPNPHISDFYNSPAWEIYVVDKPAIVSVSPFMSKVDDLAIELGIHPDSLVMNPGGIERGVRVEIRKDKREIAWFGDVMREFDAWLARQGRSSLPYEVALGIDPMRKPVVVDLADVTTPHVLIAGTTGSGKSALMNVILIQLLAHNSPDELKVAIIDPKGSFAKNYISVPHLWADAIIDQRDEAGLIDLFKSVYDELDRRRHLWFEEIGVKSLAAWNRKHPEQTLPVLLLVIDEAQDIGDSDVEKIKTAYAQYVGEIARKGREYGVLVMIGVQRPSQKNIGLFRGQINRRIILRLTDKGESAMALQADGDEAATKLLLKGDGFLVDSEGRHRFAAAFVPEDESGGSKRPAVHQIVAKQIIERWGGPRKAGPRPVSVAARNEVADKLAAEHLRSIDNPTWLVLRALELAFADQPVAWENDPASPPLTSEGLLPYIRRSAPEGFKPEYPIEAQFVADLLTRLTGDRLAKGTSELQFTRATATTLISKYRKLSEREWYVARALQAYLATPDQPEKIVPATVLGLANRLLAEPLEPALSAREVEEYARKLLGNAAVDHLRGRGEQRTAKAVVDILVNNYGAISPDLGPAKVRPSVADVANRPARDQF
jgi:hypothetical protein